MTRTDDHCHVIVPAEQLIEQLAAGGETRSGIRHEKYQNDDCRNAHQHVLIVPIPVGKEVRNGNGVPATLRIHAEAFRHQQPVQIGADRQTNGSPAYLCTAVQIRQPRQTHEQIAAHVRSLCTHGRNHRSEPPAAQIKIADAAVLFGIHSTDHDHHAHIDKNGNQNTYYGFCHKSYLLSIWRKSLFRQYRTKIVRQMRRQIFRQMKQKAE